jgi:pyruvate formate lyase activating enzyme
MKIGGLQRVSLIDYPGRICAIIFTQGCNFRCPYCHNPELVDPKRFGPATSEEEIFAFLEKRMGKLDAVEITGGEPTIHPDLERFIQALKAMKYLVKLDSNGSHPDVVEKLIEKGLVDYLAMDVKGPLEKYTRFAGVDVDIHAIQKSIDLIIQSGIEHEFRTTVVRSMLDLDDLLRIAERLKNAEVYALQAFVPVKTLDGAFLAEKTYTPEEFLFFKGEIEKKDGLHVIVR